MKISLEKRILHDLEKGNLKTAISRYEGCFEYNFIDEENHRKVSELYLLLNDKVKAGKHLYFSKNLTSQEKTLVSLYKKSLGNSSTLILSKLIKGRKFRIIDLPKHWLDKLEILVIESLNESEFKPRFVLELITLIQKIKFHRFISDSTGIEIGDIRGNHKLSENYGCCGLDAVTFMETFFNKFNIEGRENFDDDLYLDKSVDFPPRLLHWIKNLTIKNRWKYLRPDISISHLEKVYNEGKWFDL